MELILVSKKGFVLSWRPEAKKIHHASCELLSGTLVNKYPRFFSEDRFATRHWLDHKCGPGKWANCATCGGLNRNPF